MTLLTHLSKQKRKALENAQIKQWSGINHSTKTPSHNRSRAVFVHQTPDCQPNAIVDNLLKTFNIKT